MDKSKALKVVIQFAFLGAAKTKSAIKIKRKERRERSGRVKRRSRRGAEVEVEEATEVRSRAHLSLYDLQQMD